MSENITEKEIKEHNFYRAKYEAFKYFREHYAINIDVSSVSWQDISKLYNNHRTESDTEVLIAGFLHYDIIKVNYNKTKFRIIEHTYHDVIKHANKLIDVIGYDKYQEILNYSESELCQYINHSDIKIKNAVLMDIQLWYSNNE